MHLGVKLTEESASIRTKRTLFTKKLNIAVYLFKITAVNLRQRSSISCVDGENRCHAYLQSYVHADTRLDSLRLSISNKV